MIFGVNATKTAVVIAQTRQTRIAADHRPGARFVIGTIRLIPFQVRSGDDLAELLQTLTTLFAGKSSGRGAGPVLALLGCSSGRFGSCREAIKGEAMVELAATRCGLRIVKIAPQSLKKTLGCGKDQKWRDRAGELFNPDGKRPNWSKGVVGAIAAAFKVAGTARSMIGR